MKIKDSVAKTIGRRINDALDLRGVKQKELAKHLGIMDNAVSYFCSGARVPNAEQIIEIARFLNVSTDYLLGTDEVTHELCATLGLSDLVIQHLRDDGEFRDIINYLLKQHKQSEQCKNDGCISILRSLKAVKQAAETRK